MPDAKTLRGRNRVSVDVVVVGAGAGGAAAAESMASRGMTVAILEEGHRYEPKDFKASYGWALNHIYADKGTRVVQAESIYPMPGGKGVGGSTLINSAICYRAPDHVLTKWVEQYGLTRLSPAEMRPRYARVEEVIGVTQMHPLQARANNLFVKKGVEKLGLEGEFIYRNAPGCVGCGVCMLGCPSGGKGSVDRNFVPMAEEQGAVVYSDSKVKRIVTKKGRAMGVEAEIVDQETGKIVGTLMVDATRVVLSAGTIGTPLLLLKHALSNRSGEVGKNLSIHPAIGVYGFVPGAVNSWDGIPQAYAVYLDRKAGILLQTYNAPPEIFFTSQPWSGFEGMKKMKQLKNLAMCGALVSDRPFGQVSLGRRGKARIRYSLGDLERRKLIRAQRAIVKILFAAGGTEVYPGVGSSDQWSKTEAHALSMLHDDVPESDLSIYASHPMGTCRMGTDPQKSVVGPDGQSHDLKGLYIADASLMPSSLGVNPQMTVMALGMLVGESVADS